MRSVPAWLQTALATDHVECSALKLSLPSEDINITNWPEEVTINAETYYPVAGLVIDTPVAYGDTALSGITVSIPDTDGKIILAHHNKVLAGCAIEMWDLFDDRVEGFYPLHTFLGQIEEVSNVSPGKVTVMCGPENTTWGKVIPPPFSQACRWTENSQCPYNDVCAHTKAACVTRGQLAIFGGQTLLVEAGFRMEFKEGGFTLSSTGVGV